MNIRHLVTKSFDTDNDIRRSVIFDGMPIISQENIELANNGTEALTTVEFKRPLTQVEMNENPCIRQGIKDLKESPIGSIITRSDGDLLPLSQVFDFKVQPNTSLSEDLPEGTTFSDIYESDEMKEFLADIAVTMFPNEDPRTGRPDIDYGAYYTPYIPLVTSTNTMSTQSRDNKTYFNPEGTVSVAEFLDGLNAIKYGMNSNRHRKKSLDNISTEDDYFNEGYQSCIKGISSLFYNLYTRKELLQPITRCELAYILVLCWRQFMGKYNDLYGGKFYLGFNFDWENPYDMLLLYDDVADYKVSKIIKDKEYDIISLDVKDYKSIYSMEQFKQNMREGKSAIPISMFMSLIELDILGIFRFDGELAPLKEVSRGELSYVLTNLAKLFPLQYKY